MEIKPISAEPLFVKDTSQKKTETASQKAVEDKIEISSIAKELKEQLEAGNLEDYKNKIMSHYYDKPEVISKISEEILKELKKS